MTSLLLAPAADYVIERPRLLDALDGAETRLRMLIAPAGYGKTTLLRQWLAHRGTPYAWYAVGPEGSDVAAVAAKIANALGGILPGAGQRMLGRLGVSNDPEAEATILADILAEELDRWPSEAVLAIDDYQELAVSSACERFVGRLLRQAPLKLALTSRKRPRWARARSLLYGETFLLGRHELAMTHEESRRVLTLGEWTDCDRLIELGGGWPAIVALAARSHEHPFPGGALPPDLYAYFAEELYGTLTPERRTLLCQLAATPRVTPALVDAIASGDTGVELLTETEQLGFVAPHEQPDELVFHPLLRAFLEDKLRRHPDARALVTAVARALLQQRRWDDTGELIRRFDRPDLLPELVEAALPSVLAGRRIATVADWVALAREREVFSGAIDLADAELAFSGGESARAQALAEQAASTLSPVGVLAGAAHVAAGRFAHFRCRYKTAEAFFREGHSLAASEAIRRDALWGQFICSVESEKADWQALLAELSTVPRVSADAVARLATAHIYSSHIGGNPSDVLEEWKHTLALVGDVHDPRVRTSFLYQAAYAALVGSQYQEAAQMSVQLITDLEDNRMRFPLPHAYLIQAGAEFGLRRFRHAEMLIHRALEVGRADEWATARADCLLTVVSLARDIPREPRIAAAPNLPPAMKGTQLALLSLARACVGDRESTVRFSNEAQKLTSHVEAHALARFARAVAALGTVAGRAGLAEAFEFVASRGVWDALVWSYRAHPSLLAALLSEEKRGDRVAPILERARDGKLALRSGLVLTSGANVDIAGDLSPREAEVLALVVEGLTNREIAKRLFISDVTVKVHLRHIFDKLGVRNRVEAALKATEYG